jgi:5-methylcytosine-specific restriction protein A
MSDEQKIIQTMKEYDELGHDAFYNKYRQQYNIGPAKTTYIDYNGRQYPLKMIYSVAIQQSSLTYNTYTGVANLKELGFKTNEPLRKSNNKQSNKTEYDTKQDEKSIEEIHKEDNFARQLIREPIYQDLRNQLTNRANGKCQACNSEFFKKTNGEHYFEIHHIISYSECKKHELSNLALLCPNCHRKIHFGEKGETINEQLKQIAK